MFRKPSQVAIAKASLAGKLQQNPLIMGMLLKCLKVVERQEAGKSTKGRISKQSILGTDTAAQIAQEAGVVLALAGGNAGFLKKFGYHKGHLMGHDFNEKLKQKCLPVPFLSLNDPELLKENMEMLDQKCSLFNRTTGCALVYIDLAWYLDFDRFSYGMWSSLIHFVNIFV